MDKILITGVAGFVGSHLAERLGKRGELWGTHLDDNLRNISGVKGLNLIKCDLLDAKAVREVIEKVRPRKVFHLAAQSVPSVSFTNPAETLKVNIFSTLNLFEAMIESAPDALILNVGSGDEYGDVEEKDLPLKETAPLRPINPYAVSKVAQDLLAFQYWKSKGLKAVRCRPFNHFGPRQSDVFVTAAFAKQIAEIEAGIKKDKVINTGNLEASKDFLDVRDVVSAYELLIDKGESGS
ncbi:MAG: GDP-mannose 4,6-dehydratase, partial [Deltaproteobacteria bacterium]|nr:GDP-mannose 4,6-dehydratase [Deltaproteobacteria bacterium]